MLSRNLGKGSISGPSAHKKTDPVLLDAHSDAARIGDWGRNRKPPLSPADHDGQEKRVIGLEPTTFTLATCNAPGTNALKSKDLAEPGQPPRSACAADVQVQQPLEVPEDSRLLEILRAWGSLAESAKAKVYEMVKSAGVHGDAPK